MSSYSCPAISAHETFLLYEMPNAFPEIQGGGSLMLAWQIKNKRVLVVGGGEVSTALSRLD